MKLNYVYFVCLFATILFSSQAFADSSCTTTMALVSSSEVEGYTAHFLNLNTGTGYCTSVSNNCGTSSKWLYIEFADKELYAHALAAQMAGGNYVVYYDSAAPSRTGVFGTFSCRLTAIYKQ